ncbi:uncharacterized protein LOC106879503 [Octopus bimaculoides]|uniref:uncharacterized protein LOC106879503 n=1 Tax=Octopus bimaculoides TaxID=37653 RepID=UPI0022E0241F|nr:uncharacterized protein LOC106879503 [Octopus bimaculoides]
MFSQQDRYLGQHMDTLKHGRPNAGLVSAEEAEKYQMVHIGFGVYIHSDQYFEVIRKKTDGQAMVRILMNFLFSKDQMKSGTLSVRGCGRLLNPLLTKAIILWVQKNQEGNCSPVTLRQAMYRKLSYHKWRAKKEHVMQAFSLKSDPSITTIIKEESDENNFVEPPVSVTSASVNSLSLLGSFSSTAVPSNSSVTNTNIISANTNQNDVNIPNIAAIKQQIHQLNQQDTINRITLHQQQSAQTLLPFELLPQNNEGSTSLLTSANATDSTSILTPLELIAKEKGGITVNMDCLNTLLSFVCCPTCHSPVNHKETIQGFKTGILYSLQLFCINGHLIGNPS